MERFLTSATLFSKISADLAESIPANFNKDVLPVIFFIVLGAISACVHMHI